MDVLEDELGDIIGKARAGLGYSIDQLSNLTGLPASDIEDIEGYRLKPERGDAVTLARALALDPEKLWAIAAGQWAPQSVTLPRENAVVETVVVPLGLYSENSYILGCVKTRAAAVIDPGGAAGEISDRLARLGLTLDLILVTHAHGDHIGGLKDLVGGSTNIRLSSHQLDRDSITRGLSNQWEPARDGLPILPRQSRNHS